MSQFHLAIESTLLLQPEVVPDAWDCPSGYVTIAEAQTYFDGRLFVDSWTNATDQDRLKALNMATEMVNRLSYIGDKTDPAQAYEFPRGGDTAVPQDILDAVCDIALELLDGRNIDTEIEGLNMSSMGYGSVKIAFDRPSIPQHIIAGIPSGAAWTKLRPYLSDTLQVSVQRV